ncbi:MAG: FkbM family methyltransferase [Candidatus Omnitrophica bacterium]|nr:FkbM family methyltransferase [Candidatus Omnitrophota bacterium]
MSRQSNLLENVQRAFSTARFIVNHPLNRNRKFEALGKWFCWQIGSRLVPGPVAVPFVNHSRLLLGPGMTGATGNIYCGLQEFEPMSFAMHFLGPADFFVDVGANVGAYSILAASLGVPCVSFEPVPETFKIFLENIRLNNFEGFITAHNRALSSHEGEVTITRELDATNHIVSNGKSLSSRGTQTVQVQAQTLDNVLENQIPSLIKIDAEGHDLEVLEGAVKILSAPSLQALIIEATRHETHTILSQYDFKPYKYLPFARKLTGVDWHKENLGEYLYIRDYEVVHSKVSRACPFSLLGQKI